MDNLISGQHTVRSSKASLELGVVLAWCKHYHVNNRYPCPTTDRFGIGLYQIQQGEGWKGTDASYEGYMSAVLNWFMLSEGLGVPVFKYLELHCFEIECDYVSDKSMLHAVARAQQMVHYVKRGENMRRSHTRYNTETLAENLAVCIEYCLYKIPLNRMLLTMQESIDILTGDL